MPWSPARLTKAQLEERRLEGARLLQEGKLSQAHIACELGVSAPTVHAWKRRLEAGGVEALRARTAPGPTPRLSPEGEERLLSDLKKGPLAWGFRNNQWTLPQIAFVLSKTQRVLYDLDHLSVVMRRLGWSVQKPQKRALERDEQAIQTWVETTYP